MPKHDTCDTLIIGAGIVGIATAYYLKKLDPNLDVILVDALQPMTFTSAQSGENYRNWWPHPVMTAFTDHSIDLMEQIARESDNRINMNRRGYVLATRSADIDDHLAELEAGYAASGEHTIRVHDRLSAGTYQPPLKEHWQGAPSGVDVIKDPELIRRTFPSYEHSIQTVIHIRRAGAVSGQQMGQYMLESYKAAGGIRVTGKVESIDKTNGFRAHLVDPGSTLRAQRVVNAAGPFVNDIARMLGTRLPVKNVLQQKIAFEDKASAIPRNMPFSIDLDGQLIDWDEDERALLASDPEFAWSTQKMPGAIHCRPDGGDRGTWVKLGWAFNDLAVDPTMEPTLSDTFPEIVLRGAARLNPSLKTYYGKLPRNTHHYGGYYTLTDENWPLIGEMDAEGAFVVGAMSGFGTMAACAGGELCARWVLGTDKPSYAIELSPQRYSDRALMAQIGAISSRGIL